MRSAFRASRFFGRNRILKRRDRGQVGAAVIAISDGENRRIARAHSALKAGSDADTIHDGDAGHFMANGDIRNDHPGNPRRAFPIPKRPSPCRAIDTQRWMLSNTSSDLSRYPPRYLTHPTGSPMIVPGGGLCCAGPLASRGVSGICGLSDLDWAVILLLPGNLCRMAEAFVCRKIT